MPTLPLIQVNFRCVSFGGEDKNGLRNGEHEALIREIVCVCLSILNLENNSVVFNPLSIPRWTARNAVKTGTDLWTLLLKHPVWNQLLILRGCQSREATFFLEFILPFLICRLDGYFFLWGRRQGKKGYFIAVGKGAAFKTVNPSPTPVTVMMESYKDWFSNSTVWMFPQHVWAAWGVLQSIYKDIIRKAVWTDHQQRRKIAPTLHLSEVAPKCTKITVHA